MRIIVYSETTAATVGGNLGLPEYSYYFILKKYLPVLSALGEVCYVKEPELEEERLTAETDGNLLVINRQTLGEQPDDVVVTKPDGVKRAIFFIDGTANSADTSQAGGYGEFKVKRESDLNLIRVGEERYEIPDAVITGG